MEGGTVNDWKPKYASFLSHLPPDAKTVPIVGRAMSSSFLPSMSKSFSWELAWCSYCAKSFPPNTDNPCKTASVWGISSFQFSRLGLVRSEERRVGKECRCGWVL